MLIRISREKGSTPCIEVRGGVVHILLLPNRCSARIRALIAIMDRETAVIDTEARLLEA